MSLEATLSEMWRTIDSLTREVQELKSTRRTAPATWGRPSTSTIAAGVISATKPHILLVPETGTSDTLERIENETDGKIVILRPGRDGDTITIAHDAVGGNIWLHGSGNDRSMAVVHDSVMLIYNENTGYWEQVAPETLDSLNGVSLNFPIADGDFLAFDTGTNTWVNVTPPSTYPPGPHASSHQHLGGDEVATATPGANAIPKAEGDGKLNGGWIDPADISYNDISDVPDLVDVSGTPVTGNLAEWTDADTLEDSGIAASNVPLLSAANTFVDENTFYTTGVDGALLAIREPGSSSGVPWAAFRLRAKSLGSLIDGFGPAFVFFCEDSGGTVTPMGGMAGVRDGADNSGALTFFTRETGTQNERMRITAAGDVGIGTDAPSAELDVVGNVEINGDTIAAGYIRVGDNDHITSIGAGILGHNVAAPSSGQTLTITITNISGFNHQQHATTLDIILGNHTNHTTYAFLRMTVNWSRDTTGDNGIIRSFYLHDENTSGGTWNYIPVPVSNGFSISFSATGNYTGFRTYALVTDARVGNELAIASAVS